VCELDERGEGEQVHDTARTPQTGSAATIGEGVIVRVHGPTSDGIRTSDSRGWNAAADITDGIIEIVSASGRKSEGEDLTLDRSELLTRRLNANGGTWGPPVPLKEPMAGGDDCEARDTEDRHREPLRIQVVRPTMPDGFWKDIQRGSSVPPGPARDEARSLWDAIEGKRPAQAGVVLAINAIRTPWLALPSVIEAFRELYGEAASREGWAEIWVVGANETFTERLDRAPHIA
jgi:hypothetical protein